MVEHERGESDFYVGYLPTRPRAVVAACAAAIACSVAATVVAGLLALSARDPGTGRWDDGKARVFTGVFTLRPYAALHLTEGSGNIPAGTSLLVVEMGKFGGGHREKPLDGQLATLRGFVLDRSGQVMIELEPGEDAVVVKSNASEPPLETAGRSVALEGEIVDSKCWMGAMKPGDGRVHRECAMRCISGGIPPVLVSRTDDGLLQFTLIAMENGTAFSDTYLPLVGLHVRASGRLHQLGQLRVLYVGPSRITPTLSPPPPPPPLPTLDSHSNSPTRL